MEPKRSKICLNTMVANEAHVIKRMLESCCDYIDYWIIQDNGSTDGTQEIIRNFFQAKNIPGFLYEIPWQYPGYNRDHSLQTALRSSHGCDWILRIDADEILQVDDEFDWKLINDTTIESFNIVALQGQCSYQRCWLWNSKLPWKFKHDKRHETIYMDKDNVGEGFQRVSLSPKFKHLIMGDGRTWFNPTKFYSDALEIEKDLLADSKMSDDTYHLFYIGKSYRDAVIDLRTKWPFGTNHLQECARRAIFFFDQYLNVVHQYSETKKPKHMDEMAYMVLVFTAECQRKLKDDESAISSLMQAEPFCPERNEHLLEIAQIYSDHGQRIGFLNATTRLVNQSRKNPFPKFCFFINNEAYHDTGKYVKHLHSIACTFNNVSTVA